MKAKISLISVLIALIAILTSCSAITGKASLSHLKINESKIKSIEIYGYTGRHETLSEDETKKFIELFNSVSQGIVPRGEIVSPDARVDVYFQNGEEMSFAFYGKDYTLLDVRAYDKDGEQDDYYHFHSNELRDFVYEMAEKYYAKTWIYKFYYSQIFIIQVQ